MRANSGLCLSFAASALLMGGCLVTTHRDRVIREDEPPVPVKFESEEGMVQFHAAVNRRGTREARERARSSFNIPFIISSNTRHVLSRPAFFNDQVLVADVNADGTLSDAEVSAYLGE